MENRRKFTILTELCLILFIATGCFPSVEKSDISDSKNSITEMNFNENSSNESIDIPSHITDSDIEKLDINADIILPENFDKKSEISVAAAKYRSWNKDTVISELFNEHHIENITQGENRGPDDLFFIYTLDDNSQIIFNTGTVFYRTEMSIEYQYDYYFDYYKNYIYEDTLDKIFGETDINGIDKNDALKKASEVVSILNINDVVSTPKIYCMDADTINKLQNEENATDKYGRDLKQMNIEQEAYLIVYPVVYHNIPSLKISANSQNELISRSSVYFIYGRNGIISFDVSGIFDINNVLEEKKLYSPLKAIENVKQFFNGIIMDSTLDISLVKLTYIIRNDFKNINDLKIEPVWFIYGQYEDSSSNLSDKKEEVSKGEYITLISAVTGENIPIGSIGG